MLRDLLVGAVVFAIAAGSTPAQVNLPHPVNKPGLVLEYDRAITTLHRQLVETKNEKDRLSNESFARRSLHARSL
jgi:hypothetical protein